MAEELVHKMQQQNTHLRPVLRETRKIRMLSIGRRLRKARTPGPLLHAAPLGQIPPHGKPQGWQRPSPRPPRPSPSGPPPGLQLPD